jgi:oligosaccharide repeat unit polymerase
MNLHALLLALLGLLLAGAFIHVGRNRAWGSPLGLFLALYTVTFLLRPLQIVLSGEPDVTRYLRGADAEVMLATAMNAFALAAILAGYAAYQLLARRSERVGATSTAPPSTVYAWLGGLSFLVGLVMYVATIRAAGGLGHVLANLYFRREMFGGADELRMLSGLMYMGALTVLAWALASGSRPGRWLGMTTVAIAALLFLTYGGRVAALSILLAAFVLVALYRAVRLARLVAVAGVLGCVIVAAGEYRNSTATGRSAASVSLQSAIDAPSSLVASFLLYDGQVLLLDALQSRAAERQYGATYTWPVLNFVPRRYFDEKPPATVGGYLKRAVRGQDGGYPVGLAGEAFLNFGWTGVIVVPFLLGLAIAWLARWGEGQRQAPVLAALFALLAVRNGAGLSDSSMFMAIVDCGMALGLHALALLFTGAERRTRAVWPGVPSDRAAPFGYAATSAATSSSQELTVMPRIGSA